MQPLSDETRSTLGAIADLATAAAGFADRVNGVSVGAAEAFADVLLKSLLLDVVYLHLRSSTDVGTEITVASTADETKSDEARTRTIGKTLAPYLRHPGIGQAQTVPGLTGTGPLRVFGVRLGFDGEEGDLVAGSRRADFPDEYDRSLVGAAAGQVMTALRCRRANDRRKQLQSEQEKLVATLEDRLSRTDSLLADAEQLAHVGSWDWDIASGKVYWSDESYRIFGLKPQAVAVSFELFLSMVHPDDRPIALANNNQALRDQEPHECRFRVIGADQTTRVAWSRAQCVFGPENHAVRMFGIVQDITESARAEEAINESQQRFRAIFENSLDGIVLFDDHARYIDSNPAMCQLLGYPRAELVRMAVGDVTPAPDRDRIPHDMVAFIAAGMASGKYTMLRKDGTTREVEYRAVANILPGVHLAAQRDITERERAEEETRILSSALENAVEGVARVDTNGRFLSVNRAYAANRGYQPDELAGASWRSGFLPNDVAKLNSSYQRMLADGRAELEVNGMRKDGSIFCMQKVMVKVHDRDGQWIGHYCFTKDITDRKLADEALRKSAARLQVLSQRVVDVQEEERRHIARELHDQIGGVLSAISVNLHSVIGACDAAAAPRIVESIHIVDQAIEQVRNLSLDLRPAMLDELGLAATLRWYTDRQAQRAKFVPHFFLESSGVLLPDQVTIACFRIAQEALTNIVRHAQAREVWVELRQGDEDLQLVVRDDGRGFDSDGAYDRAARGETFGLLGMKERAELLRGRLKIISRQGQGTTVHAWFPIAARTTE